jgi:phosphoribosylglycinamide formyltransferase 1
MTKLAILISGRGSNMAAIIAQCRGGVLEGIAEPAVVAANREDALGLTIAREEGIPAFAVPSAGKTRETFEHELHAALRTARPDLVILAGFMRILSPYFIEKYRGRILNIHPADTRQYRGAHGYEWAWENHLSQTAITIHLVCEELDAGRIVARRTVDLRGARTLDEVQERGLEVEHELYPKAIADFIAKQNASAC